MISLKSSVYLDSNCSVLISNNTDFKSVGNLNGLWIPGDSNTPALKDYFINDVYFFTYVIFNSYSGAKSNVTNVSNVGALIAWDTQDQSLLFSELMDKYMIDKEVSLPTDGYYTIFQLLIPKESIKDEIRAIAADTYYVKDDGYVYITDSGVESKIDLLTLVNTNSWNTTNIVSVSIDIVSKCYLDLCFNYTLEQFAINHVNPLCAKDSIELGLIKEKRDLLFAITNTIQYYTDNKEFYKAAKMIYDVTFCNICRDFLITNSNLNCGCNG